MRAWLHPLGTACSMLQVIPFLVLAVGVDNMFILANTLDATDSSQPLPQRVGQALSSAGPSITLAATAGQWLLFRWAQCYRACLLCFLRWLHLCMRHQSILTAFMSDIV